MIRSMFSGVTGLRNHQTFMDVVSNNIANINTTGFKAGRITFEDVLNQSLRGASAPTATRGGINPAQVGLGSAMSGIDVYHGQGDLQPTGKQTDLAIQGDGYFILTDGVKDLFTRDGAFDVGSDGLLVAPSSGLRVRGWVAQPDGMVDAGQPPTEIAIPFERMNPAVATTAVTLAGNLDARSDGAAPFQSVMVVYDSLGVPHNIELRFTKVDGENAWDWEASTLDPSIISFNPLATGTITFDETGNAQTDPVGPEGIIELQFDNGAADMIGDLGVAVQMDTMTGFAQESTVNISAQDGHSAGSLTSFTVSRSGEVLGVFSNGFNQVLGQIALAKFSNPGGLVRVGNNSFQLSVNSGLPIVSAAGLGGLGQITSGSLEMSNSNLAQQFTNMIMAERGFQANSRVITTSDEMLQDLISLKR